jgi:hypothetical protein
VVPFDWGAIDAGALNLVVLICAQLCMRKIEAFKHDSYLRSFDLRVGRGGWHVSC